MKVWVVVRELDLCGDGYEHDVVGVASSYQSASRVAHRYSAQNDNGILRPRFIDDPDEPKHSDVMYLWNEMEVEP